LDKLIKMDKANFLGKKTFQNLMNKKPREIHHPQRGSAS